MKAPKPVQFTRPEIEHICFALLFQARDQSYYGRRDHYHRRHDRILAKLQQATQVEDD